MSKLITDWVKVAESGKTIDGRNIEPQWLLDAAELYSKTTYTAIITLEHFDPMWAGNYGTVEAMEAREENGAVSLYAKLCPTEELVSINREGQKIFTSVKFTPNFRDSGKMYVSQIGVTDTPASIGTEQLAFRAGADTIFFGGELSEFKFDDSETSILESIKSLLFSAPNKSQSPEPKEDDSMTPEQLKALQDGLAETLKAAFTPEAAPAPAAAPAPEADPAPEASVTVEAFTAQTAELADLKTAFAAMEEKMKQPVPPTDIDNPGSSDEAGCDL